MGKYRVVYESEEGIFVDGQKRKSGDFFEAAKSSEIRNLEKHGYICACEA